MRRTTLVIPGLLFCFFLTVSPAGAAVVTFDFVSLAAGNEHGAISETFTISAVSVTATARSLDNMSVHNMYLDDLFNGNPGGLGVCQQLTAGDQCTPSSDDNITVGEVLVLTFNQPVTILQIEFSNGQHLDEYTGNFGVAIDSNPTTVAGFTQYGTVAVFSTPLTGTTFSFISNATISNTGGDNKRQLYISSMTVTTPEPGALGLLALGLGALAWPYRKWKHRG